MLWVSLVWPFTLYLDPDQHTVKYFIVALLNVTFFFNCAFKVQAQLPILGSFGGDMKIRIGS